MYRIKNPINNSFGNNINFGALVLATTAALFLASAVQAQSGSNDDSPEDSPEQIISTAEQNPAAVATTQSKVISDWQQAMRGFGLDVSGNPEKVTEIIGGTKFIVSHMERVQVSTGQPGWVESRVKAYERAMLVAKAELAKTMEETVEATGNYQVLEDAAFAEGNIEEVRELSEGGKLLRKGVDLVDTALDSAISRLDPEYDPNQYDNVEEKIATYQNLRSQVIRTRAAAEVAGATIIYMGEGPLEDGSYGVVVSLIWTPKMSQVAKSMLNKEYHLEAMEPGRSLMSTVPRDEELLLATQGVRVVVDENGQFGVMAYAQAQPRKTSVARQGQAIQGAKDIASTRARGYLVNFVRATVSSSGNLSERELAREFSDLSFAVENIRRNEQRLASRAKKTKLVGIRQLNSWSAQHPVTGQWVAGAVIGWSPSSMNQATELKTTLKESLEKPVPENAAQHQPQLSDEQALKSIKVDIGNY